MELIVAEGEARLSVKDFLVARFGGLSQMYLRGRVYRGFCLLDGVPVENWGKRVRAGQRVEIEVDLEAGTARRAEEMQLEIVYEDASLLVVNKAAGMLVHPTKQVHSGTLANGLAWHLKGERFWFPHRLDQDTSGVMVVAKTEAAMQRLTRAWKEARKEYVAWVEGVVEADEMTIEAPIGRDPNCQPAWGVREDGKRALSRLWVMERGEGKTRVRLEPVTGRTNQLRIHCAHVRHPIVGDRVYGSAGERMELHARRLEVAGYVWEAEEV